MKYTMYKDNAGHWRWRLTAANNRTIADSGESYHNKTDCLAAIGLVKSSSNAPVHEPTGI
ncbi:MAG: DUF1508 domain-containing protein [Bacteroidota bacterium]